MVHVGVAVHGQLRTGQPAAVDDPGVVELVGEHAHARAAEHAQRPEVGGEPGGEADGGLGALPRASSSSSSVWIGREPGHQARGPRPGPPAVERVVGGRAPPRVRAQSEIVVGGEGHHRVPIEDAPGPRASNSRGARQRPSSTTWASSRPDARPSRSVRSSRRGRGGWRWSAGPCRRGGHLVEAASRASTMRTISSAVVVRGGMSTTTSPSGRNSTPADTAPAQTRRPQRRPGPGRRQLDAHHEPPLADGARRRSGAMRVGQQSRRAARPGPARWPGRPTPRSGAGARGPPRRPAHSRRRSGRGRRSRARGRRPRKASKTAPEATVADMGR